MAIPVTASAPVGPIDVGEALQTVPAPGPSERCEGIAFSPSGRVVAVASPDTNTVFLFRRGASGLVEDTPYWRIQGPESRLNYPHDVAFSCVGQTELLAVAQRRDAIALYARNAVDDTYGPAPAFEIRGRESRLSGSDGVAFVPPHDDYLAACNLDRDCVSFYRREAQSPVGFRLTPTFELRHGSLVDPVAWRSRRAAGGSRWPTTAATLSASSSAAVGSSPSAG